MSNAAILPVHNKEQRDLCQKARHEHCRYIACTYTVYKYKLHTIMHIQIISLWIQENGVNMNLDEVEQFFYFFFFKYIS